MVDPMCSRVQSTFLAPSLAQITQFTLLLNNLKQGYKVGFFFNLWLGSLLKKMLDFRPPHGLKGHWPNFLLNSYHKWDIFVMEFILETSNIIKLIIWAERALQNNLKFENKQFKMHG